MLLMVLSIFLVFILRLIQGGFALAPVLLMVVMIVPLSC